MQFNSPSKGRLTLKGVISELLSFINEERERDYKIIIGTDSNGRGSAEFVTAVIVHRVGRGGRYFWIKYKGIGKLVLRQRIYKEVELSLNMAQKLIKKIPDDNLEIHVDVGQYGETRAMIKEVIGMVRGSGFDCKTKPESYGASHIADKHT